MFAGLGGIGRCRRTDLSMVPRYSKVVTHEGMDWLGPIPAVAGTAHEVLLRAYMAPDLYGIARGKKTIQDSFWFQVRRQSLCEYVKYPESPLGEIHSAFPVGKIERVGQCGVSCVVTLT